MSSHHFVKEGQEPALIISDANAVAFEKIQELLEWSPTVIVIEPALHTVLSWGIKIDVALVPISAVGSWKKVLHEQGPLKLLSYSDEEPLVTAFYFLLAIKQHSTHLVASWNKDLPSLITPFQDRLSVAVMTGPIRWSFVPSGKFEKWIPANSPIEIFSLDVVNEKLLSSEEGIFTVKRSSPFWIGTEW
jgi:thiamine pyrophosphokinase